MIILKFALKRNYLHNVVFEKFPDFKLHVSSKAFNYYKYWIYKPITSQRRQEFNKINKTRFLFNQLVLDDSIAKRTLIPTMREYRDFAFRKYN